MIRQRRGALDAVDGSGSCLQALWKQAHRALLGAVTDRRPSKAPSKGRSEDPPPARAGPRKTRCCRVACGCVIGRRIAR